MMRGNGVIVLRLDNGYTFHEHASIQSAKAEAARLASTIGGKLVVYVPVAIVEPAPKTIEHTLVDGSIQDEMQRQLDVASCDEFVPLPF